jgi:hypothetical protein
LEERADELTPEQLEQCEDGLTTIETALREPDSEAGRRLLRGGLRQFMDAAARLGGLTAVVAAVQAGVQALLS